MPPSSCPNSAPPPTGEGPTKGLAVSRSNTAKADHPRPHMAVVKTVTPTQTSLLEVPWPGGACPKSKVCHPASAGCHPAHTPTDKNPSPHPQVPRTPLLEVTGLGKKVLPCSSQGCPSLSQREAFCSEGRHYPAGGAADTRCIQTQTLCLALQLLPLKSSPRGPTGATACSSVLQATHATCASPDPPLCDRCSCPWR